LGLDNTRPELKDDEFFDTPADVVRPRRKLRSRRENSIAVDNCNSDASTFAIKRKKVLTPALALVVLQANWRAR
jgi:hypothetical protein